MSICFDVNNMNTVMETFCPEGESVITSVYGVGRATQIIQYFGGCEVNYDKLVPAETNNMLKVFKKKVCTYDLYIGYTEKSIIISECDMSTTYFYDFENITTPAIAGVNRLEKEISLKSIGKAFPLDSVKSFQMKKGIFGSIKCYLELSNGTFFKFLLTKNAGGVVQPMPNHAENRDKVIEILKKYSR